MITIRYHVNKNDRSAELEWLLEQKIYPSVRDWDNVSEFGMIVSPEAAVAIKLRHKLDTQTEYRQR